MVSKLWFELTGVWLDNEIVMNGSGPLKNLASTRLPRERRNRIDMALLHQGLRRGEYVLTWVPSKANLSDCLTKERERASVSIAPDLKTTKLLLDALKTSTSQLKGIRRVTKTKEDVSTYYGWF